jgi:hypothetical protein
MKNPMTMNYELDNSCVCHFLLCNVNMYLIVIEVVFRSYSTAILSSIQESRFLNPSFRHFLCNFSHIPGFAKTKRRFCVNIVISAD